MDDDTTNSSERDGRKRYLKVLLLAYAKAADNHVNEAEKHAEQALAYKDAARLLHKKCAEIARELAILEDDL